MGKVSKRVKRASKKVNTDTAIKIAGLGLVGFFALKMLTPKDSDLGSGSGYYSGSGTDLSGILPFLQETPPTFNITNPEIPSGFFINPDTVLTKKDVTTETTNSINDTFLPSRSSLLKVNTTVGNTTDNNLVNILNPEFWLGNRNKILSESEYNLRSDNYSKYRLFKTPTDLVNASVNPLGFIINLFKPSSSGSGGGGGGCPDNICKKENTINTNVNLTTKNLVRPITNYVSNNQTANNYLSSIRENKNTLGIYNTSPAISKISENEYYITNSQNLGKYYDYSKKEFVTDLSNVERAIQSNYATNLASGNCGSATSVNACSGTKKETNYNQLQSSNNRYYENTGTSLTRKDLVVN
jgi:hypothetical protein